MDYFSPKPWTLEYDGGFCIKSGGQKIARLGLPKRNAAKFHSTSNGDVMARMANGALMKAAPDLLHAMEDLLKRIADMHGTSVENFTSAIGADEDTIMYLGAEYNAAVAATKKARGE